MFDDFRRYQRLARDHHLEVGDTRIKWTDLCDDPRDAKPLVVIHGITGTAEMYFPQLLEFARTHRAIGYGYRGDADLEAWATPRYTHQDLVDDLLKLLDHLGIERAVVFGSSFGGTIALAFARQHPDRVDCLVLHATFARYDLKPALAQVAGAMGKLPLSQVPFRRLITAFRRLNPWEPHTKEQQNFLEQHFFRTPFKSVMRRVHFIRQFDIRDELPCIPHRTLLLWGADDIVVSHKYREVLEQGLPVTETVILPRCGHSCWISDAKPFNLAIHDFLNRPTLTAHPGWESSRLF